ncbi:MAG TPA: thiamine pyrophosphate-dependent enzyme [Dehalococcoidia bacterium]|nr:thiamine pyrophosphate-dependent enzyme [Dehalococcoidia bacterium]
MEKVRVTGGSPLWTRPEFATIPFCPGCQEPVASEALLQVLEETGLAGEAIAVVGIGCNSFLPFLWKMDFVLAAHGRPPDVATAVKRILKYPLVFTVQGDGDCFAIGAGSTVSAAIRGEKITIIMLNNNNYGTTGGQMSPTTILGQRTSTTPLGRGGNEEGFPAHVAETMATFKGVCYSVRTAVNGPASFQRTKRCLRTAFQMQMEGRGLSFVEIIVACPPNRHLTPLETVKWIDDEVLAEFPLGEFKNSGREEMREREPAEVKG